MLSISVQEGWTLGVFIAGTGEVALDRFWEHTALSVLFSSFGRRDAPSFGSHNLLGFGWLFAFVSDSATARMSSLMYCSSFDLPACEQNALHQVVCCRNYRRESCSTCSMSYRTKVDCDAHHNRVESFILDVPFFAASAFVDRWLHQAFPLCSLLACDVCTNLFSYAPREEMGEETQEGPYSRESPNICLFSRAQ
jgi:hypothetical protein